MFRIKVYYRGEKWVWDDDGGLSEHESQAKLFTLKKAMILIYKKCKEAKDNKKHYCKWELICG